MKRINLKKYDRKCVRITTDFGEVLDGNCEHLSRDFCECEIGIDEECLELVNFVIRKSQIEKIEIREDEGGPYGCFRDPYGTLEKESLESGFDIVEDFLFTEDKDHCMRMLRCLENEKCDYIGEVVKALKSMPKYTDDEEILKESEKIIN